MPPVLATRCLIALVTLVVAVACDDRSSPMPPSSPSAPPSSPPTRNYTAPIEGVIREVGGGPVAGQAVMLLGLGGRTESHSDAAGRFRFESLEVPPTRSPRITAYRDGYVGSILPVPFGLQRPAPVSVELRLQPQVTLDEGVPLRITLSNDDLDYGYAEDESFGLPGERGPVKVVFLRSATDGPHALRAEWSTPDQLHLWAEIYYLEQSFVAFGTGTASLLLPRGWARDPRNPVVVTVGLPRSARATGGISGTVNVTLTLGPAYPAP
jgi:hypothetical protein